MRCPNCRLEGAEGDIRCRRCGAELNEVTSTSLVPAQNRLPTVLQKSQVQRTVAAGMGALVLGVGIELLRRGLLARLTRPAATGSALPALGSVKDILSPRNAKQLKRLKKGYEIQETAVIIQRRIIRY